MAFVLFMGGKFPWPRRGMGMKHVCNICAPIHGIRELQCSANKYGSCLQIALIDKQKRCGINLNQ